MRAVEKGSPKLESGRIEGQRGRQQKGLVGFEIAIGVGLDQPNHRSVGNRGALGSTRGTRCVLDIGQLQGVIGQVGPVPGPGIQVFRCGEEGGGAGGFGTQVRTGHDQASGAVLQNGVLPLGREVEIDGHIAGTRFEDPDQGPNGLRRTGQANCNSVAGPDPLVDKQVGHLVGPLVDRRVTPGFCLPLQTGRLGILAHLCLEELVDG